ncbi:MAG: orotidine-5'-phosphate decarboxylase [Phycisphaerae bacterium]
MARCFADRLVEAVRDRRTPGIINMDPVLERLPAELRDAATAEGGEKIDRDAAVEAIQDFCRRVIRVVAPLVPAVKLNIAYFERYHAPGIRAYRELIQEASQQGLIVIGDVKRGDVGHTAELYARAQLGRTAWANSEDTVGPDAVTISGAFGWDGVRPFVEIARDEEKGLFVLVRTSNVSAAEVQDVEMADGRKAHDVLASLVDEWAATSGTVGDCGYSSVGAVVATRDRADAVRLRAVMPKSIFLVPGYGAQGGTAEDFAPYLDSDGLGALVAAGRSVIYAYQQASYQSRFGEDWEGSVEQACRDFVADLARGVG